MTTPVIEPDLPDLEELTDLGLWGERVQAAWDWLATTVMSIDFGLQAGAILLAAFVGFALRRQISGLIARLFSFNLVRRFQTNAVRFISPVVGPALAWLFLSIVMAVFAGLDIDTLWVRLAANLMGAWALIRLLTAFIAEPFWARTAAFLGWTLAAMNIIGWLGPTMAFLDGLGVSVGDGRVSVLTAIQATLLLVILYWIASRIASAAAARINTLPSLNPSARLLIGKTVQAILIATAFLLALSALGVPLGAFAIFSGAIGLGIGFGLQKIFSNLVSGVILLMDRSIKPGDVITVDDTYGRVNSLGMRFASVITRDGFEHLIPNEEFITTKVINWSYSDHAVRVKRPIGISYGSDVHKAIKLVVEAVETVPRVLKSPQTRCLLRGFGDNSVDLEVRFWIADPGQGVNNVASEVLLSVWDAFHENGIQFPFPQRDVHIDTTHPIEVRMTKEDEPG